MEQKIRKALATHAKLDVDAGAVPVTQNLFDVGLTSFACVQLMMRLEEIFDIEFPDELLKTSTFETIASIVQNVKSLGADYSVRSFGIRSVLSLGTLFAVGVWRESSIAVANIALG